MRITHLGHACLLVEVADQRILIDPGGFAGDFLGQRHLDAVLITHQHADHLDTDRLPELIRANGEVPIWCDPQSVPVLATLGLEGTAHDGSEVKVGDVTITPFGEMHALIHDDIPRITNVGVRITADGEPVFFHPGDALDAEPGHVDVLAFPLNAPWQASREMTGFLRRLQAPHAVPMHDALLSQTGRNLYLKQAGDLGCKDTEIHDLSDGDPWRVEL
ncbi:MAG: MBL fold metallo-hydrolase [Intrasporangiaceae bacterium]|nr:MBL fold metallo-hydrolase [Intrasporangiaceae bacterium]